MDGRQILSVDRRIECHALGLGHLVKYLCFVYSFSAILFVNECRAYPAFIVGEMNVT